MEPMNLGSPVHSSPASATFGTSNLGNVGTGNQGFLPGYLMGDPYSSQQSGSSGRLISPTKLNRSLSQNTPQTPLPSAGSGRIGGFLTPTTPASSVAQTGTPTTGGGRMKDKHHQQQQQQQQQSGGGGGGGGGPPVTGLYSSVVGTPNRSLLGAHSSTPYGTPNRALGTPVLPNTPHQLSFATPSNSVREEIPYNAGMESTTWVTVFGFPPSASGYILSQFSQYGSVLQHHSPPNGNWMNIKYQTKIQAQKALSKSGKILGGSIMIGVTPCTDMGFLDELNASTNNFDNSVTTLNSSLAPHNKSSIRPLTQAYKVAQSNHEVLTNPNTPDRSNGFVSKAMEYIFGW